MHWTPNLFPCCWTLQFQLNDYEIRKGKKIGVTISFNNHRLFVGNIPKNRDRDELLEEFTKYARKFNQKKATNLKYTQQIYLMQESKNENIRECIFWVFLCRVFQICVRIQNFRPHKRSTTLRTTKTTTTMDWHILVPQRPPSTTNRNRFAVCSSRVDFFFRKQKQSHPKKKCYRPLENLDTTTRTTTTVW